jgi:glycerophosphoryl diester phosphodiesterase
LNIWAHRGCSYEHPENTIPAFEAACKLDNVTGIELDIQFTKDNKLVVIHDESIDRTTNGSGLVNDYTLDELKQFKILYRPEEDNERFTRIPTIEEVLTLATPYCMKNGLLINVELKNNIMRYEGMEQKILSIIGDFKLEKFTLYSSFNAESIRLLKELKPDIKTGILCTRLSTCIEQSNNLEVNALHPRIDMIDKDILLTNELPVRAWNNTEPFFMQDRPLVKFDIKTLEEQGITDLFTNVPELYLK